MVSGVQARSGGAGGRGEGGIRQERGDVDGWVGGIGGEEGMRDGRGRGGGTGG